MGSDEKVFKCVIIGNPFVGKTSLRRAYLGDKFQAKYLETIGSDFSFMEFIIEDEKYGLAIWDLAGQPKFESVHPLYYKGATGAIIVFSVVEVDSFNNIFNWVDKFIETTKNKDAPILIIGNKIDLLDSHENGSVSLEDQSELVKQIRKKYPSISSITSLQTSAKTGENVKKGIDDFGLNILKWFQKKVKDKGKDYILSQDIAENFPSAYAITMNQINGPRILAASIETENEDSDHMSNSAIKLIASLDFDDIIAHSAVLGTFPWVKPLGTVYYIAFVLENEKARGAKELYVIGVNANRDLEEALSGLKGIMNGFLHGVMNEFNDLRLSSDVEFVTKSLDMSTHPEVAKNIEAILFRVRNKIHNSVLSWYNIPKV
ncbi:MAG: Rab family GTPase [Candidatus Kariarchaeaceae archaeon]